MHALQDIFKIWDSLGSLARDTKVDYETVLKWGQRKRIPPEHWDAVIEAARRKSVVITPGLLHRLNSPRKVAKRRPRKAAA